MFQWWRELLEIKYEFRERRARLQEEQIEQKKVCSSCETLKQMNDHLRMDNEKLLRRILEKPEPETRTEAPEPLTMPLRKGIPWHVRRQMLEAEDRAKAKALSNAAKPDPSIAELEKDLDVATAERENQSGTK